MTREEREEALDVLTDMANALYLIPTTRQGKVFKLVLQELQKPEPCTDAISRQYLVEKATSWKTHFCDSERYVSLTDIQNAPSVKPQYTESEIQKMQDLESAEIQKAYEIGKAENPNKWIPVSEKLPEDGQNVLFSTKTDRVFEGKYYADTSAHNWLSYKDDTYAWNNVVTAWMPLPEPYKASPTGEEVKE